MLNAMPDLQKRSIVTKDKEYAVLSITDDGPGIAEGLESNDLFDPFFTKRQQRFRIRDCLWFLPSLINMIGKSDWTEPKGDGPRQYSLQKADENK